MMPVSTARFLYDFEFINAGCPAADHNPLLDVDNTFATYFTNFMITLVCLIFAATIFIIKKSQQSKNYYMVYFLIGIGLLFFVSAVGHVVVTSSDQPTISMYVGLAIIPNSFGSIALLLLLLSFYGIDRSAAAPWNILWWSITVILVSFAIISVIFAEVLISVQLILFLATHVCASIVYFQKMCCKCNSSSSHHDHNLMRRKYFGITGFGFIIMISGIGVQFLLAPYCGDGQYENCFDKCPLPAPTFNHNALFHVLYLIGTILIGVSEIHALRHTDESEEVDMKVIEKGDDTWEDNDSHKV